MGNYIICLAREHHLAVVASTFDLGLAKHQADQIIFLSKEQALCFNGWQDMLARGGKAVQDFLHLTGVHAQTA